MGLIVDMQARGLWTSYENYVRRTDAILVAASRRGMPVSPTRHAEVVTQLAQEMTNLEAKMQSLVPDGARQQRIYKRKPPALLPWKPSIQGLTRYATLRGHRIPEHWKKRRPTFAEAEVIRLQRETHDPLYQTIIEHRSAQTLLKNHVKNWAPGDDERVHPIFYFTATGQLEARRPNTMNAPHHKPSQGPLFRSIVRARPSYKLLEFDYKSFHALYLAWLAGDKVMERMARIDLVSFATAHFLRLPKSDEAMDWPDDQLRDWLKWVKVTYEHERNAKMKHAFHGYDNGMRAHGCYMRYRDYFSSRKEVERALAVLDDVFCVAKRFRDNVVEQAHLQGFLMSKFGCIRYFWEVKKWQGNEWSHGEDAEAAISFPQQNHAHCHLKDVMLKLDAAGWLDRAGFYTPEHDSLKFECPAPLIDEARVYIQSVMEAVNAITGLSVEVETKVGDSWDRMQVVD